MFVLVGYQDPDSLGGVLTNDRQDDIVEFEGVRYHVEAEIKRFSCFRGHANSAQIADFLKELDGLKTVLLVHLDECNAEPLISYYRKVLPDVLFVAPAFEQRTEHGRRKVLFRPPGCAYSGGLYLLWDVYDIEEKLGLMFISP